jgi:hypothetical protein
MPPLDPLNWACDQTSVERALPKLGIDVGVLTPCRCPLPGHTGSASVQFDGRKQMWKLRCDCPEVRDEQHWLLLAEVRASIAYGDVRHPLTRIEAAVWYFRLGCEAGVIEWRDPGVPDLPPDAPAALRALRDGFELMAGIRIYFQKREFAFSGAFAAAWCDAYPLTPAAVYPLRRELLRLRIIERAGQHGRLHLYRPGKGTAAP